MEPGQPVKMRRAFLSIPVVSLWLVAASPALALPVEVAISGVISGVEGALPGDVVVDAAFSGILGYDPEAANRDAMGMIELAGPSAVLQLDIGGPAVGYRRGAIRERLASWTVACGVPRGVAGWKRARLSARSHSRQSVCGSRHLSVRDWVHSVRWHG